MVLALAALGCSENAIRADGVDPDSDAPEVDAPAVEIAAAQAFDPLLGPLDVEVRAAPSVDLTFEIRDAAGIVVTEAGTTDPDGRWSTRWEARDGAGWEAAGVYTLSATVPGAEGEAPVGLVRAGFVAARLEDDAGVSATREPLYWPVARELRDAADPVATLAGIDDGRAPLDFPAVAEGPMAVRPDGNEPAAFVYDSRPLLSLDVATVSALGGTGLDTVDVAVSAEGWTVLSGVPLRPGTPVLLQRDAPLGDTIGISELDLALVFSAGDARLGSQRLPLRLYRVLGRSQFASAADKYRPWAPMVEASLAALEGTTAEVYPVLDALVDFVYFDLDLSYDTQSGAAAYSVYTGDGLSGPHLFLTDFLTRRNGSVINCSDAGNILGAYANMIGAPLDHLILDPGFQLNFIQAIGATEHTSCPFGPGGCSFNYHAVTTTPGSELIWDATLALDGDGDPGETPNTDLLVQEIPADEYLDRLVRSGFPQYNSQIRGTLE